MSCLVEAPQPNYMQRDVRTSLGIISTLELFKICWQGDPVESDMPKNTQKLPFDLFEFCSAVLFVKSCEISIEWWWTRMPNFGDLGVLKEGVA
jgi:hypothetical protein